MNNIHTGKKGGFASVIGQQEAASMITQTMQAGRLPHAIMVCGPSGCGKLPFAHGSCPICVLYQSFGNGLMR